MLIVELVYTIFQKPSRVQNCVMILIVSLLINYIGGLLEMKADTLNEALVGVKIAYIGKPFILLSTFFLVLQYCNIEISKIVSICMIFSHVFIMLLVMVCEYHNLFYSSIEFTQEGLYPHLVVSPGIIYSLYFFMIMLYCTITIGISLYQAYILKSKREKKQMLIFIISILIAFISYGIYLCGVCQGYDCTLLGYLIATFIISFSIFGLNILDVMSLGKEQAMEHLRDGIIVMNLDNKILYMNRQAKRMTESLCKNRDDESCIELLENYIKEDKPLFFQQNVYSVTNQKIHFENVVCGNMYVLNDITDNYKYTHQLQKEVEKKTKHIRRLQHKVTLGMADVVENRDSNTGGHVKRTSEVVRIFVERLKTYNLTEINSEEFYTNVISAAPMHDLGKIAVEDAILRKPGGFTKEEFEEMKTHSEKGAQIVEKVLREIEDDDFLRIAINIAHYHHERWDGKGYPCRLANNHIPFEARIMALADVFDALVSKRYYKESVPYDKAFGIIEKSLGTQFDPDLGLCFLECKKELIDYYESVEH